MNKKHEVTISISFEKPRNFLFDFVRQPFHVEGEVVVVAVVVEVDEERPQVGLSYVLATLALNILIYY